MGTAVFHPQDCLIAPHRDRNLRFFGASEYPPSAARPCRTATPETLAPFADWERNISPGILRLGESRKQIHDQGFFLGRKEAAAGLLPVPPQVMQMPRLDSSASVCFPWNGMQVCEGRVRRAGSRYCTAAASQKPNFSGSSHFSDVSKHGCPRWTDIRDQKVEYRKRMQSEVTRRQTHLCRKVFRPPLKVLPASQTDSICTSATIQQKKHGMGKQLKRSASEKRQEVRESPPPERPGTEESIGKLMANSSEGALLCCNGYDVNPTWAASTADKKRTEDPQVSWDALCHGRLGVVETGVRRSLQEIVCQQIGERNVDASLQTKGDGNVNEAMQCEEKIKRDKFFGAAGFVTGGNHTCTGDVEKNSCHGLLEPSKVKPMAGSKLISRSLNSVMQNDRMWVPAMHDERWAGPSFFNSPSPSSLPVPSFTVKFSRSASTGSEAARSAARVAHMTSNGSLLKESGIQDVAVATKDLRRMLNLDHGSGDM